MAAVDRGRWKRSGTTALLVVASLVLLALNLAGQSPLKTAVLSVARPVLELVGGTDPVLLGDEQDQSQEEMAFLRAKNARLTDEVLRLRDLLATVSESPFDGKRYAFRGLPARVLCRAGVSAHRRVVLVDRGAVDGVTRGLGVVSGDRVVGRVWRVGDDLSLVVLVNDPSCRVRSNILPAQDEELPEDAQPSPEGICQGIAENASQIRLRHMPLWVTARAGDAVVTTGQSGIFPAGMSVGHIEEAGLGRDLFQEIRVKPAITGERLRSVLVLLPVRPQPSQPIRTGTPSVLGTPRQGEVKGGEK